MKNAIELEAWLTIGYAALVYTGLAVGSAVWAIAELRRTWRRNARIARVLEGR